MEDNMSNKCVICDGKGWIIIERQLDDATDAIYSKVVVLCHNCSNKEEIPTAYAPSMWLTKSSKWKPSKVNQDIVMCRCTPGGIEQRPLKWWEKIIYFRYINANKFKSFKVV